MCLRCLDRTNAILARMRPIRQMAMTASAGGSCCGQFEGERDDREDAGRAAEMRDDPRGRRLRGPRREMVHQREDGEERRGPEGEELEDAGQHREHASEHGEQCERGDGQAIDLPVEAHGQFVGVGEVAHLTCSREQRGVDRRACREERTERRDPAARRTRTPRVLPSRTRPPSGSRSAGPRPASASRASQGCRRRPPRRRRDTAPAAASVWDCRCRRSRTRGARIPRRRRRSTLPPR